MPVTKNLVYETATTTGTGNFTLAGAETGFQSFNDAFGTGGTDAFFYFISNSSAAEWEAGTGHLSASTTLVRDTVYKSSNSDAAVNFSAGTKNVTSDTLPEFEARHLLLSGTISSAATVDIDFNAFVPDYPGGIIVRFSDIVPQTDSQQFRMRVSSDGSSFDSGATDYRYISRTLNDTISTQTQNSTGESYFVVANAAGNGTGESLSVDVHMMGDLSTAGYKHIRVVGSYVGSDAKVRFLDAATQRTASQTLEGIQVYFASGNVSSGRYAVYGVL